MVCADRPCVLRLDVTSEVDLTKETSGCRIQQLYLDPSGHHLLVAVAPRDGDLSAALLLYPRYLDPMTRQRIEAEDLLARFEGGGTDPLVGRPLWHRAAAAAKRRLGPLRGRI